QLCRHNKPIAIYNIDGFYDEIQLAMISAVKKNFIRENCLDLYVITEDADKIFEYVEAPAKAVGSIKELKDG
ncbi:MAG: LOG family protein, partial [Clostridia bacterium]|nr:LOG family protein [Clostridia bacterium]